MTENQVTATPAQTHRLAALSAVVGIVLLLAGLFQPLITRINYSAHVGCPDSPTCPSPYIDASSYWRSATGSGGSITLNWAISLLVGLGPLLALLITQTLLARGAWSGYPSRSLLWRGVLAGVVTLLVFLLVSYVSYCFFFCNLMQGFPVPGQFYSAAGLWAVPGVRYLAPGFWLLLSGLLLAVGTDLTLLARLRAST